MKRSNRFSIAILLIFYFIFSSANISAKEEIVWMKFKLNPTYIFDGSLKGLGMGDLNLPLVLDHLPEYQHSVRWMNNMRVNLNLKHKEINYCSFYLFKTQLRQKHAYFSLTTAIVPPVSIIYLKEKADLFGNGVLSLNNLMQNSNLKMGIIGGRAYGIKVNEVLDKYSGANHIMEVKGSNISESTIRMLLHKRFDYTIDFPHTIAYFAKLEKQFNKIEMVIMKENPKFVKVSVGCSRTETNRILIGKINMILKKIRSTPKYYDATWKRWVPPGIAKRLKQAYKNGWGD